MTNYQPLDETVGRHWRK